MGICCEREAPYDENSKTYITYSDLIHDVDKGDEEFLDTQDAAFGSHPDKLYSFKVRLSKFKGKLFSEEK